MHDDYKYGPQPSDETVIGVFREILSVNGKVISERTVEREINDPDPFGRRPNDFVSVDLGVRYINDYEALARELAEALKELKRLSDQQNDGKPIPRGAYIVWNLEMGRAGDAADAALAKAKEAGLL